MYFLIFFSFTEEHKMLQKSSLSPYFKYLIFVAHTACWVWMAEQSFGVLTCFNPDETLWIYNKLLTFNGNFPYIWISY